MVTAWNTIVRTDTRDVPILNNCFSETWLHLQMGNPGFKYLLNFGISYRDRNIIFGVAAPDAFNLNKLVTLM